MIGTERRAGSEWIAIYKGLIGVEGIHHIHYSSGYMWNCNVTEYWVIHTQSVIYMFFTTRSSRSDAQQCPVIRLITYT